MRIFSMVRLKPLARSDGRDSSEGLSGAREFGWGGGARRILYAEQLYPDLKHLLK